MSRLYLQHIPVLSTSPLFAGIAETDLPALLGCLGAEEHDYLRDEFILRAGRPITSVGVLVAGGAHIIQEDYWGNRAIIARVTPGDLFAESFCCAHVSELPVSVQALADSQVLFLDFNRILGVCSNACNFHSTLLRNMLQVLAEKSVQLTGKLKDVSQRSTREKLLSYLSRCALACGASSFDIPFNRQELADYLAVDRSALSAEISRMQQDGLLRYHKSHFELL
ncbi:MAG: Crp/Fnr family transcriptional regulator [Coriobacteriales bacterium]|jgi:CRP-like cAMP-binding protein|nr:Crp/Fnr family transcriptional regulator [Coriobacteriales bacterium]